MKTGPRYPVWSRPSYCRARRSRSSINSAPWWKGTRGEWYVVAQVALLLLTVFGPRHGPGSPAWPDSPARAATILGGLLLTAGAILGVAGGLRLGANLTPLPRPREQAVLVETGPFAIVRHPIYSGAILAAFGWGLFVHGLLTLGYAVLVFLFLDVKSRREERWLEEKFSGYAPYRKRVRKLIPFLY